MDSQFTQRVSDVIQFSKEEANRLKNTHITPEHLVLGMIREGEGKAISILQSMFVNLKKVKATLEEYLKSFSDEGDIYDNDIIFDQSASRILKISILEARMLKSKVTGTEHMLLAILRAHETKAAQVLGENDVMYEDIKEILVPKAEPQSGLDFGEEEEEEEESIRRKPEETNAGDTQQVTRTRQKPTNDTPVLDSFGTDMTQAAADGKLDPVVGREKEIEQKSQLLKNMEIEEDLKLFCLRHHKDRIVSLRDVQIYFGDKKLKSLSFDILNGDRIALQGQNGCGKSSFIKVILQEAGKSVEYRKIGETEKGKGNSPMVYSGRIQIAPGLIISYVPQDSSFLMGDLIQYGEMKGLDIPIFLSLLRKLDFEREQFEKNMRDYSAGQKKKVLLAASLCERAHLYVWDEPLNYIDVFSRMQLEELLNTFRPTLLMVEHDKGFVEKICDKMIDCE